MINYPPAPAINPFTVIDPKGVKSESERWNLYGELMDQSGQNLSKLLGWLGSDAESSLHIVGLLAGAVLKGRPTWVKEIWSIIQISDPQHDIAKINKHALSVCHSGDHTLISELSPQCTVDQLFALEVYLLCPLEWNRVHNSSNFKYQMLMSSALASELPAIPGRRAVFHTIWDLLQKDFIAADFSILHPLLSDLSSHAAPNAMRYVLLDPVVTALPAASLISSAFPKRLTPLDPTPGSDWRAQLVVETISEERLENAWVDLVRQSEWAILNHLTTVLPIQKVALWTRRAQDEILKSEAPLLHAALLSEELSEHVSTNEARPRTQSKM